MKAWAWYSGHMVVSVGGERRLKALETAHRRIERALEEKEIVMLIGM
jgi:hypothetical protein